MSIKYFAYNFICNISCFFGTLVTSVSLIVNKFGTDSNCQTTVQVKDSLRKGLKSIDHPWGVHEHWHIEAP